MVGVVGFRVHDPLGGVDRVYAGLPGHPNNPFGPKSLLCIQVQCAPVESSTRDWKLDVYRELMAEDGFSNSELSIKLCYRLGFQPTPNQLIERFATRCESESVGFHLHELVSPDE